MEEYELTINDLTAEEFFLVSALEFAMPEFEELSVDGFMLGVNAEQFEQLFVEGFREDAVNAYVVDGNSLFWFEDGEVATEFRRLTPSVVSESTWGQVKAATLR